MASSSTTIDDTSSWVSDIEGPNAGRSSPSSLVSAPDECHVDEVSALLVDQPVDDGPSRPSRGRVLLLIEIILPIRKETRKQWLASSIVDIASLIVTIVAIFTTLSLEAIVEVWYMAFVGILAATVAMATPASGGIIYFPFVMIFGLHAEEAVTFSVSLQAVIMGIIGLAQWCIRDHKAPFWWLLPPCIVAGWAGSIAPILALPIHNDGILRLMFSLVLVCLAIYVTYLIFRDTQDGGDGEILVPSVKTVVFLTTVSFFGGIMVGYLAVGVDLLLFILLTSYYRVDTRIAIINAIILMGVVSYLPALLHVFHHDTLPTSMFLLTLLGAIIGAKIGPVINILLGKRLILSLFVLLLIVEVARTIIMLLVLPAFTSDAFFWE